MKIIADLHIHSRYARACSKDITVKNLEKYARLKGITVLGTGDFQHPKWSEELKNELVKEEEGIAYTQTGYPFIYQTEISLIYSQNGRGYRIHNLVLAPGREVAEQVTEALKKRGRVDYDGRPIFNIPCPEFVEMLRSISQDIEVIPAHAWTPWFSLFGSKSGFNSVKECFQDQTDNIRAIETGLSSDPAMNWRLSQLDKVNLVSFSDMHSYWPWRIGREATIFALNKLSYKELVNSIRTGEGLAGTIEFFPEEGKYHYDGHRNCHIVFEPQKSKENKNICPVCKKGLTLGVLHRVEELADKPAGEQPPNAKPYFNTVPLSEVISLVHKTPVASKKTWELYFKIVNACGNELNALLETPIETIAVVDQKTAEVVRRCRNKQIQFQPGYDGEYGKPLIE